MIGQGPIGAAPIAAWWQTAGVSLPVFRVPPSRMLLAQAQARVMSITQARVMSGESQSRIMHA